MQNSYCLIIKNLLYKGVRGYRITKIINVQVLFTVIKKIIGNSVQDRSSTHYCNLDEILHMPLMYIGKAIKSRMKRSQETCLNNGCNTAHHQYLGSEDRGFFIAYFLQITKEKYHVEKRNCWLSARG